VLLQPHKCCVATQQLFDPAKHNATPVTAAAQEDVHSARPHTTHTPTWIHSSSSTCNKVGLECHQRRTAAPCAHRLLCAATAVRHDMETTPHTSGTCLLLCHLNKPIHRPPGAATAAGSCINHTQRYGSRSSKLPAWPEKYRTHTQTHILWGAKSTQHTAASSPRHAHNSSMLYRSTRQRVAVAHAATAARRIHTCGYACG
jgi:hypothetical protein